jgi:hypothetical protein
MKMHFGRPGAVRQTRLQTGTQVRGFERLPVLAVMSVLVSVQDQGDTTTNVSIRSWPG